MDEKNMDERLVELAFQVVKTSKEEIKRHVSELHLKALDDLVNVNSLFTIAVFVGLSMANRGQLVGLDDRAKCHAGPEFGKLLVVYEVIAFACFLLSSLVSKVIKLHLYLDGVPYQGFFGTKYAFVSQNFDMKDLMLIMAAASSVVGIILLTLSIVNIVQIRIGLLSCRIPESWIAVLALCTIIGIALIIYVVTMALAIYASFKSDKRSENNGTVHKKGSSSSENMPGTVGIHD